MAIGKRWSLFVVLCALVINVVLGSAEPSSYSFEDPSKVIADQIAQIHPITSKCSSSQVMAWVAQVDDIWTRLGSGAFAELPPNAMELINTLNQQVVCSERLMNDTQILARVVQLMPSLWKAAFYYVPMAQWKPTFAPLFDKVVQQTKSCAQSYDKAVNATSLMIRFTKDSVFTSGEDNGGDTGLMHYEYVPLLADAVAKVSKQPDFCVTEAEMRAYMNTIPSKKDGMDVDAPYPVFVDTSKYADSDFKALQSFLTSKTSNGGKTTPRQQQQY